MANIKIFILAFHNLLRWAVVIIAAYAAYRVIFGRIKNKEWLKQDQQALTFFMIALDIQLVFGLLLYFVFSDLTKAAFANFGAAMAIHELRFFSIEHSLLMAAGIAIVHISQALGKKDIPNNKKWSRISTLLVIAILLIVAGIPWTTRPLLPGF